MQIQPENIRRAFQAFNWKTLFLEELLWSKARPIQPPVVSGAKVEEIAHLGQIPVYEVTSTTSEAIPDTPTRRDIHARIAKITANCLLIFTDKTRTQTVWLWAKRENNRFVYRESVYVGGQNGDLFLSKLAALFVDIESSSEGGPISALRAGKILQNALDVSKITKRFYEQFRDVQLEIAPLIEGLPDAKTRARYTLVLLHRLMFIYFLQKRRFIDEDTFYLENKLEKEGDGEGKFFETFLKPLFFQGFAKPDRSPALVALIGDVPYLNGGLFLEHPLELAYSIAVPDGVFKKILGVFKDYDWYASDDRDTSRGLLSPELLGFIFEKFINDQKSAGAYYTPEALTSYLCERTIEDLILDKAKDFPDAKARNAVKVFDLIGHASKDTCERLWKVISTLRVLDPAVGSGAFLVAAFYTLADIYIQMWGRAKYHGLKEVQREMIGDDLLHPNGQYAMFRRIITHNLYGVDLMEGAPEIARLRLFLALVSTAKSKDELEPLPNIDFNILEGNSLIGFLRSHDLPSQTGSGQITLGDTVWNVTVVTKQEELERYMSGTLSSHEAALARDRINDLRLKDATDLDQTTLQTFSGYKIGIETKTPDGKTVKRALTLDDISALRPFHWAYEFPAVMQSGGFDAIITNPPWEVFKPNGKEFLQSFSKTITKKTMSIKDFEDEKERLIKDPKIKAQWDEYQASFPFVSEYFRKSPSYSNQISVVNGKKAGTDINLYKLFVERCFDLLQPNGRCGIVIPSGIYTDLGAKQLREMLFERSQITGLFCFENRKMIFEGVDSRFKFVALSFAKGKNTTKFPAAFMRHDVNELAAFPARDSLEIGVALVRKLSPDSLSVMEFKSEKDVEIAKKMLEFPLLGEKVENQDWEVVFHREFHMTDDAAKFLTAPTKTTIPLYEGKLIWQFTNQLAKPRLWVEETVGRKFVLGRNEEKKQTLEYQIYRLAYRAIASNTNERSVIMTILPPCFTGNSLNVCFTISPIEQLYAASVFNSFVADWFIRNKVAANINMFYLYQLPVPRLTASDAGFGPIVKRAAQLICTTPEFDDLAKAAGIGSSAQGVTDEGQRAKFAPNWMPWSPGFTGWTKGSSSIFWRRFLSCPNRPNSKSSASWRSS